MDLRPVEYFTHTNAHSLLGQECALCLAFLQTPQNLCLGLSGLEGVMEVEVVAVVVGVPGVWFGSLGGWWRTLLDLAHQVASVLALILAHFLGMRKYVGSGSFG